MKIVDKGGRRSGTDRRQLLSPITFPERRTDVDCKGEVDRRSGFERRSEKEVRVIIGMDRRKFFKTDLVSKLLLKLF
jgi:hypothetical protein